MRFFHFSDLHLGKSLHAYDLIEDQRWALDRVVEKISGLQPEVLLIAGDVYDRAVPSVEAIQVFDTFLRSARAARPGLEIVIVPGNHDSAGRLSFAASLLADSGLRIAGKARAEPALVLDSGGRRAAVWAVPFLTASSAPWPELAELAGLEGDGGGSSLRSQQEYMRLALGQIRPKMAEFEVNVLVAHCFAAGGQAGDSERAFVGLAEQVDTGLFDGFDYVALGHLHSFQSPAPRVRYSGSLLAYSLADAGRERGLLCVEFVGAALPGEAREGGASDTPSGANDRAVGPKVELIPIPALRSIRQLTGRYEDLLANPLSGSAREDYIEIRLTDSELVIGAGERFKALYPRVLNVKQAALDKFGESADAAGGGRALADRSPDVLEAAREDFLGFYREMTGGEPSPEVVELFQVLAREASDASD